ncbi:MAG: hypothetical protein D6719_10770 [Candidatus Dadabacteria bacterium]|nr:MAG: hypothetical protein D6719_10770 [Candidatus Dadabacteria bacterium]
MVSNKTAQDYVLAIKYLKRLSLAVLLITITILVYSSTRFTPEEIRRVMPRLSVLALDILTVLLAAGIICSLKEIWRPFRRLSKPCMAALPLLYLIIFLIVTFLTPRTNRIYFDEFIYQNVALSILESGRALMVNDGDAENGYTIRKAEYNKQPPGYPFLLSLLEHLTGVDEYWAHFLNRLLLLTGMLALFGLVWLLNFSEIAAIFSSTFFGLTPVVLRWSNTASSETAAATFSVLALFSTALYARNPLLRTLFTAVVMLALSSMMRPESILIIIPAVVIVWLLGRHELKQVRILAGPALLLLFMLPTIFHLIAVSNENWGSEHSRFSFYWVYLNLPGNLTYFLNNREYPVLFSILAILSLYLNRNKASTYIALSWLAVTWGVFIFFYAGSYYYGADDRFVVLSAAPLSMLAGTAVDVLTKYARSAYRKALLLVLLIVSLINWAGFIPYITRTGEEANQARASIRFARKILKLIPADAIVFSHIPSFWLIHKKNSLQSSYAMELPDYTATLFKSYSGGVYFYEGFWCNVPDQRQRPFCDYIKSHFRLSAVKEHRHRKMKFTLYRLYRYEDKSS